MPLLTIPLKAVPKARGHNRPKGSKGRGQYTPEQTRTFEEDFHFLASQQWKKPPLTGRLEVFIRIEPDQIIVNVDQIPDFRAKGSVHGDCTNLAKSVEDALKGVLWEDDGQIDMLVIERG